MKKNYTSIVIAICMLIFTGSILTSMYLQTRPVTLYDTKIPEGTIFEDAAKSPYFNYIYTVTIDKRQKQEEQTRISFNIDISPKIQKRFENVKATAFIDDSAFEYIAVKSYNVFGSDKDWDITIDKSDPKEQGLSIARGTLLESYTDIDAFIKEIKKGINVKISWKDGVEYVYISEVKVVKE